MIVYLAGGLRSGWQDRAIAGVAGVEFIDPRTHGLTDEREYTAWDLAGVARSDLVLAYLEASNPTGHGLALECGHAHAKGIPILLVDEQGAGDPVMRRRLGMLHACATWDMGTLDGALAHLREMVTQ